MQATMSYEILCASTLVYIIFIFFFFSNIFNTFSINNNNKRIQFANTGHPLFPQSNYI